MKVDGVSSVSFQASIPRALKDELFSAARLKGNDACFRYLEQAKKVESWGLSTSMISADKYVQSPLGTSLYEQAPEPKSILKLFNYYFAPFKKVEFNQKKTLLDTFMSLTEHDIIKAENKLNI